MLEAELAFVQTLRELLDVVEASIVDTLRRLVGGQGARNVRCRADLERIATASVDDGGIADPLGHLQRLVEKPFYRLLYTDAVALLEGQHDRQAFAHTPKWGESLSSEHEKWLAGEFGPTFVTHYPASLKPFYMLPSTADPSYEGESGETVACFDLLFPGLGEMAGGSLREHRLTQLEGAMDNARMDKDKYEWYLDLRRYGSVPHGGWGMGWERWVCWVTGVGNIRDVVAFPRWKGNCRY